MVGSHGSSLERGEPQDLVKDQQGTSLGRREREVQVERTLGTTTARTGPGKMAGGSLSVGQWEREAETVAEPQGSLLLPVTMPC